MKQISEQSEKAQALIHKIWGKRGVHSVTPDLYENILHVVLNRYFIHSPIKIFDEIPAIADGLKEFGIKVVISLSSDARR